MRQALELALEALETPRPFDSYPPLWRAYEKTINEAITAIKEALAQTEQEPLEYWNAVEGWVKIDEVREHFDSVGCATIYKTAGEGRVPLSLALAQPEQEPVAFYVYKPTLPRGNLGNVLDSNLPWVYDQDPSSGYSARMLVYTTPPQRKPLTDEEIQELWESTASYYNVCDFARAIEAAHGIKE